MQGKVIFTTKKRRITKVFDYHYLLGNIIALATRTKGQKLKEVKVHAALVYEDGNKVMVRSMESRGELHIKFTKYIQDNRDNITIVKCPIKASKDKIIKFNKSCKELHVKYDYRNLLVFQAIYSLYKKLIFKDTYYKRICSEDVVRQLSILGYEIDDPESMTPNKLYNLLK